jgi:hypothetical protein
MYANLYFTFYWKVRRFVLSDKKKKLFARNLFL